MSLRLFTKIRKPVGFQYKPRFYDEAQEKLEARLEKYKLPNTTSDTNIDPVSKAKDRIRDTFRSKQKGVFRNNYGTESKKSSIRLLQIIVILTIIAYLILKSDFILKFIQKISG
ncbi:MAG TPA: hypothetical protein PKD85_11065 [Saprospiraceae bacterium]|nr:hypothetical protein [Saprospiraceae bacterium]